MALITGGYLVVERPNEGLVLSTSARFYSSLEWRAAQEGEAARDTLRIIVESTQFGTKHGYELRMLSGVIHLTTW